MMDFLPRLENIPRHTPDMEYAPAILLSPGLYAEFLLVLQELEDDIRLAILMWRMKCDRVAYLETTARERIAA